MRRLAGIFFNFAFLIFIIGCADENPNLVNPPSLNETVRFRFFNLGSDNASRQLSLSNLKSQETGWGQLSAQIIPPPSDSLLMQTLLSNQVEYTLPYKFRIIRDQRYTVFAVPKQLSSNPADTLLIVGSSFIKLQDTNNCFLQMVNISPQSDESYSLVSGCPNGLMAFAPLTYLATSSSVETKSGKLPFSLIRHDAFGNKNPIALFELNLSKKGDYLLIITGNTPDKIFILNKLDSTSTAMQQPPVIGSTLAFIRTVNLSESTISAERFEDDKFLSSLTENSISDYNSATACQSEEADSINIFSNGSFAGYLHAGLVVNSKYSLIIADSADDKAIRKMIIQNQTDLNIPNGESAIRVINFSDKFQTVTLSLGARNDAASATGYRSGEVIATNLGYNRISNAVFVLGGRAPITLFSASSPVRLLYTGISRFDEGKSYLVIITNSKNGEIRIAVVEEQDVNRTVSFANEGAFAQIANITPGLDFAVINIANVINSIKLFNSTSIATVLPLGSNNFASEGTSVDFSSKKDFRDLIVLAGTKSNPDAIHIQTMKMAYNSSGFNRRFVNAASDISSLMIYDNDRNKDTNIKPIVTDLAYKAVSETYFMNLERKYSYFFYEQNSNRLMKQINDISMTFGKNYTIIFGGDSTIVSTNPTSYRYSLLLLQEY